jgi:predicted dehydrogenase
MDNSTLINPSTGVAPAFTAAPLVTVLPTPSCSSLPGSLPSVQEVTQTKLAIFGVGRWGTHLLRNFLALPQAQVVAVVDPCRQRLQQLPQQFELTSETLLTECWQTALSLTNLDAIVVATPASTHYLIIRTALERGCHVLAEKPLTLDTTESLELCRLAEHHQRQLVVDHTYLFHPAVQRGKEIIQQGQLGELRYGYAARTHLGPVRQDVDALWDLAIHDIAIFNRWLGQSPVEVHAQGKNWLYPHALSDLVWVTLTYANGFQASIHLCWSNPDKQRRLSLAGSEGTLVFDELATTPLTLLKGRLDRTPIDSATQAYFTPVQHQPEFLAVEPLEPLQQVCTHFLSCVQQNLPSSISSGWLGSGLVATLSALRRSLQTGERVEVDI